MCIVEFEIKLNASFDQVKILSFYIFLILEIYRSYIKRLWMLG